MKAIHPKTMLPFFRLESDGSETCFLVETQGNLTPEQAERMSQGLAPFFKYLPKHSVTTTPSLTGRVGMVGPRLSIETPQSSAAVEIMHASGYPDVQRIEVFQRYDIPLGLEDELYLAGLRDLVTQESYFELPETYAIELDIPSVQTIPLLSDGIDAVRRFCAANKLKFTESQFAHIEQIFRILGKNPTDVALFQLAQMWSDHCRHLLFNARLIIDGEELPYTLFDLVRGPHKAIRGGPTDNILIGFHGDTSAIEGYTVPLLVPADPGRPSTYVLQEITLHLTLSGETHNYPNQVAPKEGSATEIGGELRDQLAGGIGSDVTAAGCGRVVGSIRFPNRYRIPGEFKRGRRYTYPLDKALPHEVVVKGLDGWQSYANCFGKPCSYGFFYSGAIWRPRRNASGRIILERIESMKPVCYGVGIGTIRQEHLEKKRAVKGMLIVQIGGPAYPIGFCGGSGSSVITGGNTANFDVNAIQRGYAEMERRFYQVLLTFIAMGERTPIIDLHDQGAGGIANVLTELIEKYGGKLFIGSVRRGDATMPDLKVWICEYQERQGLVIHADDWEMFRAVCERENCPVEKLGEVTEDGRLVVYSEKDQAEVDATNASPIIDLPLAEVLANLPPITITDYTPEDIRLPLRLPAGLTLLGANKRVLRRSEVGSKAWITRGVDGSISGNVILNQYCGPFATPINDCTVIALSDDGIYGQASSLGVQPYLTALDPACGARMAIGEMVTNLMGVGIKSFECIQLICNWMWPGTINPPDGEVARMVAAAKAAGTTLQELLLAIIGGKDSSSMATMIADILVKSIETIVMTSIAPVPDVDRYITPDIKRAGDSSLILLDIANGNRRLGGSSFAQTLNSQLGDDCPDLDNPDLLRRTFNAMQELMARKLVVAGHDVSSGGLLTTVEEMCFAAGCGVHIGLPDVGNGMFAEVFAEELGYVIECPSGTEREVQDLLNDMGVPHAIVGLTFERPMVTVDYDGEIVMETSTNSLRREWERTGHNFRRLRVNEACADREWRNTRYLTKPVHRLTFEPKPTSPIILLHNAKPKVAIIREQGTNGHPEMIAAWKRVGFEPTEVHMSDLESGRMPDLRQFQGIVFPGGFSYGDVLGAAVGWAMKIKHNDRLRAIFEEFFARPDTFSFGVCNGAQLGLRCGWAPLPSLDPARQPFFTVGPLGSFNHQWIRLRIEKSPAIMLAGMEGSIIPAWVANAEGYFNCDAEIMDWVMKSQLAPLVYADAQGRRTSALPHCPSGSFVAGVCDPTGRHLYMMPHAFDRGSLLRQWCYVPPEMEGCEASPWLQMGQNALAYCRNS